MKKLLLTLIVVALSVVALTYFFKNNRKEGYQIVTLTGGETYTLFSNPFMMAKNNADGYSALPLYENDLISIKIGSDDIPYRYSKRDGNSLKFRVEGFKQFLNNRLISVTISDNPAFLDWLNTLTPKETSDLKQILVMDTVSGKCLNALKKLAQLKPELGIFVDQFGTKSSLKEKILELFNPVSLIFNGKLSQSGLDKLYTLTSLELLYMDNQNLDKERLLKLHGLKTLMLGGLESEWTVEQLVLPESVTSLTLVQPQITNIEFLRKANRLQEFNLILCDSIVDIGALAGLPNLSRIGFVSSKVLNDLSVLSKIASISRFSFPYNTTNQVFSQFVKSHKNLKIIDLMGCENITDLEPLRDLPELSCLSIYNDSMLIEKLAGFKNLDYLSVNVSGSEDSSKMRLLKEKMPDTIIVSSKGLCLGTGWVLLVIPLFLFFCLFGFYCRKRYRVQS